MRKILDILVIAMMCVGAGIIYGHTIVAHSTNHQLQNNDYYMCEVIEWEEPKTEEVQHEIPTVRLKNYYDLSYEDRELLEYLAMGEAEGEGLIGKALVMRVVLNRCEHDNKSVKEVIYHPGAFSVVGTPRMHITPTEECHEALEMVLNGWDESNGARWFSAGGWSAYGTHAFQHGNHYFSN